MYVVNKVQLIYYGPIHARPIIPPPSGAWGDHIAVCRDENGKERRENPHLFLQLYFLVGNGNGNGKIGRENKIGITGYRERNQSVGSMPITIGNR